MVSEGEAVTTMEEGMEKGRQAWCRSSCWAPTCCDNCQAQRDRDRHRHTERQSQRERDKERLSGRECICLGMSDLLQQGHASFSSQNSSKHYRSLWGPFSFIPQQSAANLLWGWLYEGPLHIRPCIASSLFAFSVSFFEFLPTCQSYRHSQQCLLLTLRLPTHSSFFLK